MTKDSRQACRQWYNDAVARGFIKPSEVSNIWHFGDLYNIRSRKGQDFLDWVREKSGKRTEEIKVCPQKFIRLVETTLFK